MLENLYRITVFSRFRFLLSVVMLLGFIACAFVSCSSDNENDNERFEESIKGKSHIRVNTHLPEGIDSLRILSLGNSFSVDALSGINEVAQGVGVSLSKCSIYMIARSSCSLRQYATACMDNATVDCYKEDSLSPFVLYYMGGARMPGLEEKSHMKILDVLSQPWDVIVMQQYSAQSADYSSCNPYISYLLLTIADYCPNNDIAVAWMQTWSYSSKYGSKPSGLTGYEGICHSVINLASDKGLNWIIPVGTAIQNLRNTHWCDELEFTRDMKHLDEERGRMVASMTFYNSVLAPFIGKSIDAIDAESFSWNREKADADFVTDCMQCVNDACRCPLWVTRY